MGIIQEKLKSSIALSAKFVSETFDTNNKITNKVDFVENMLELAADQSELGFYKNDTTAIRANICRAAAFKNVEALEEFNKALPNMLTKKTWIPVPKALMDLSIYPSKEHREQDKFRLYTQMALKDAKGESQFTAADGLFAPKEMFNVFRRMSQGIVTARATHTPKLAGFVPIVSGY